MNTRRQRRDSAGSVSRTMRRRLIDFGLYIMVGLAVAVLVLWFADRRVPRDTFAKWGGLALFSAILLGTVVTNHRHALTRAAFWLSLAGLFTVHVIVSALVLVNVDNWKIIWFGLLYPVELVAIEAALAYLGHDIGRRQC
jgi:hypothetical protein